VGGHRPAPTREGFPLKDRHSPNRIVAYYKLDSLPHFHPQPCNTLSVSSTPTFRCTIDNLNVSLSLTLPLRPILVKDTGGTAASSPNIRAVGGIRGVVGTPEVADILDMPRRPLRREDHHLVRIRTFGTGFRRWIRIGQDLSL